jgi:hypothetical protein
LSSTELAKIDAQVLGDFAAVETTAAGGFTAATIRDVAAAFDKDGRNKVTREADGRPNEKQVSDRIRNAALAGLFEKAGKPVLDLLGVMQSDEGSRLVSIIASNASRLMALDADLSLATELTDALIEVQAGIRAVASGTFRNLQEWKANRDQELIGRTEITDAGQWLVDKMIEAQRKPTILKDIFAEYLQDAETEQQLRNEAEQSDDIFGEQRSPQAILPRLAALENRGAQIADQAKSLESQASSLEDQATLSDSTAIRASAIAIEKQARELSPMEIRSMNAAQLFGDDGGFALAGETTTDGEAIARQRAEAEAAREAADRAQGRLFDEEERLQRDIDDTARFNELTADLYDGNPEPTAEDIDRWKAANPEKWAELTAMRERALREAGYAGPWYHGRKTNWTTYDPSTDKFGGLYLADERGAAEAYSRGQWVDSPENVPEGANVIALFAKLGKTLDIGVPMELVKGVKNLTSVEMLKKVLKARNDLAKKEKWKNALGENLKPITTADSRWKDALRRENLWGAISQLGLNNQKMRPVLQSLGYDSVQYYGRDDVMDWNKPYLQAAIFDPTQIKSADPISPGPKVTPDQWADTGDADIRYQFAGERANIPTFMRDSLETARTMAAEGKTSEEIRAVTGWFPSPYDGKMRWEIPDSEAKLTEDPTVWNYYEGQVNSRQGKKLSDVLDHPALFEAYPQLRDVVVNTRYGKDVEYSGVFLANDPRAKGGMSIFAEGAEKNEMLSALLHEIQHAIQHIEGFAKGTNLKNAAANRKKSLLDEKASLTKGASGGFRMFSKGNPKDRKDMRRLNSIERELKNIDARKYYLLTAGEFEARDVQARASYTAEQRAAIAPYSSENISPKTAIVMFQNQGGPRGPKGSIQRLPDNKLLVKIFDSADFTTFTHEFFHAFEMLGFPGWTDAEVETYQRWAGYTTFGRDAKPTGKAIEKGARGWERYLAEGKAPLVALQELFDKIAKWMLDTYKTLGNRNIDVEITPEIRALFDKLAARMGDTGNVADPLEELIASFDENETGIDPLEELLSALPTETQVEAPRRRVGGVMPQGRMETTPVAERMRAAAAPAPEPAPAPRRRVGGALLQGRMETTPVAERMRAATTPAPEPPAPTQRRVGGAIPQGRMGTTAVAERMRAALAPADPNQDLTTAIEEVITEAEKRAYLDYSKAAKWTGDVAKKMSQDFVDWVMGMKIAKRISDIFSAFTKRIPAALFASFAFFSAAPYVSNVETFTEPVGETVVVDNRPVKQFTSIKPSAPINGTRLESILTVGGATFPAAEKIKTRGEQPTSDAQTVLDYVNETGDNNGQPYIIVSKKEGVLRLYDKDGGLLHTANVLVGKEYGDYVSGANRDIESIKQGESQKITAAGRFETATSKSAEYGEVVPTKEFGATRQAIHTVCLKFAHERRAERLEGKLSNRISFGCINVHASTSKVLNNAMREGGVVYVTPDFQEASDFVNDLRAERVEAARQMFESREDMVVKKGAVDPLSGILVILANLALARKRKGSSKQETVDAVEAELAKSPLSEEQKNTVRSRLMPVIDKSFAVSPIVSAPQPTTIVSDTGVEISTDNGSPVPPAIDPESDTPVETLDDAAGVLRFGIENPPQPPVTDFDPEKLYTIRKADAQEEADMYGFDRTHWAKLSRTFGDLLDAVMLEPAGYGETFLDEYIQKGDFDRVLTDRETARLAVEAFRRKKAVDEAFKELQGATNSKKADRTTAAQSKLDEALSRYRTVLNVTASTGTAAGRALNARKIALREDYSLGTLSNRTLTNLNSVRVANGKPPLQELPESEKKAVQEFAAKFEKMQAELDAMRAQLDGTMSEMERQQAMLAELSRERDATMKNNKSGDTNKVRLIKRVSSAAEEARKRLGVDLLILDEGIRYQFDSESDPQWTDRVLVLSDILVRQPDMSNERFAEIVGKMFGVGFAGVADQLRQDANAYLKTTMEDITGVSYPSPEEIVQTVDGTTELTREDVYDLAKAHVFAGARNTEVLDRVFADLAPIFEGLTREAVAQLFTNYGEITDRNPTEEAQALRAARSLELIQRQIDDLLTTGQMKRTGKKKESVEIELRDLRKKRDDLAKQLGYVPRDPATNLSSAQTAAKKRMQNEIEALEKAISTGTPRVRVRVGVEYTEDMKVMREKLSKLRETYNDTFGQERTPEERMKRVMEDLDRRIAKERELIKQGILKEPKTEVPVLESPELTARRDLLKELRKQKLEAYDALNPGKRALAQAMKEAQDAVKRRQELLTKGLTITPAKRKRGEGVDVTEDLMALWEAADAMDVLLREMRKNRPLTPEQEQKKLDLAYKQALDTRDKLREKIAKGDLTTEPRKGVSAEQRTRAVREESAALRKQLVQMQKDAGVGIFSEEAREEKRFSGLQKRLDEIRRKRRERDYSKRTQQTPATSERIREKEIEIEIEKMQFDRERAIEAFKELSPTRQALAKFAALYQARQILNLSLDMGVISRQFGKVQTLALYLDARSVIQRKMNREKADIVDGTIIGQMLKSAVKAFLDPKYVEKVYSEIALDPAYPTLRANGLKIISPHESSHEITSEGKVVINPLNVMNSRLLAAFALTKGAVKIMAVLTTAKATGGVEWSVLRKAVTDSLISAAALIGGLPVVKRIEAAQNAMLNKGRVEITKGFLAYRMPGVDLNREPDFQKRITEMLAINMGQVVGESDVVKLVKNNSGVFSVIFNFVNYQVSNLQSVLATPIWRALFEKREGTSWRKQTLAAMSILLTHQYSGIALRLAFLASVLGIWDEEDDDESFGVVFNPKHPQFLNLKVGKTYFDLAAGMSPWLQRFVNLWSDTEISYQSVAEGYEEETEVTPRSKSEDIGKFLRNRLHSNVQTVYDFGYAGFHRDTQSELGRMDKLNSFDLLLDDLTTNLMVRDGTRLIKEQGQNPVKTATMLGAMFAGANVKIYDTPEEKDKKENERYRRYLSKPEE